MILTTENTSIPFSSCCSWHRLDDDDVPNLRVYKLFSKAPLDDDLLDEMFTERRDVQRHEWHAYPKLDVTTMTTPFQIVGGRYGHDCGDDDGSGGGGGGGVFYVSAMEVPCSTMETQSIAGRNVALLLAQAISQHSLQQLQ